MTKKKHGKKVVKRRCAAASSLRNFKAVIEPNIKKKYNRKKEKSVELNVID